MLEEQTLLTGTPEEKVIQCLKKAGWYEGRNVDISEVESYYSGKGITLTEPQKDIFREFYGLAEEWFFNRNGSIKNKTGDFVFHIISEDCGCSYSDLEKLEQEAGECPIYIGEIGYYYPSWIFLSCDGRLWERAEYDGYNLPYRSYDDMISLIKYTGAFDYDDWNSVRMRQHE